MATTNNRKVSYKKLGAGAAGAAFLALVLSACAEPQTQTTEPQAGQPTTEQQAPVTADDVTGDTEELIGQTVTVRGEIDEVISQNVLRMGAGGIFTDDILVVLPEGFELPTQLGTDGDSATNRIQVTGEVQQFNAEAGQQFNVTVPQDQANDFDGKAMIIAESVSLSPTPDEISDNPQAFLNEQVAIEGSLEELGPNTFRLSGGGLGGGDILVLMDQQAGVPAGQNWEDLNEIVATGELQQMTIAELQQQFNWDDDLRQQLEQDYADRPVMMAQQIFPLDD